MKKITGFLLFSFINCALIFTGCSSVFSGGTGGTVVDSESTSTPKSGIGNVDVYAYMNQSERDFDFQIWSNGTQNSKFSPTVDYYGHTTTDANGNWTISKLVWSEDPFKTAFGKDADYTKVYLVFYHSDYGCTKDETIILSDSSSDCTYTELSSIIKRTNLTLNFVDVATDNQTGNSVHYEVIVPQRTDSNPTADSKTYSGTITGSGTITIRYPRYATKDGTATYTKTNTEYQPIISVNYYQACSDEEVVWAGCKNEVESGDFSFYSKTLGRGYTGLSRKVLDSPYNLTFYGKATKLSLPSFSGTLDNENGVEITLKIVTPSGEIDCGSTTTDKRQVSTTETIENGYFSALGAGAYWKDFTYKERFTTIGVKFYKGQTLLTSSVDTVRSDKNSYDVVLSDPTKVKETESAENKPAENTPAQSE